MRHKVKLYIVIIIFFTALFWLSAIDMRTSAYFYDGGEWVGRGSAWLSFFYYPLHAAFFVVPLAIGAPILLLSFIKRDAFSAFKDMRGQGALLVLSTLVFSGLMNGLLLKGVFARPRPEMLACETEFYRPFEIAVPYLGAFDMSFPCGHCSTVFAWFAFFFLFKGTRKVTAFIKYGLGLFVPVVFGALMTISRMSFGAHFLSDGVFAGLLMFGFIYFTARLLALPKTEALPGLDRFRATRSDYVILALAVMVPLLFIGAIFALSDGLRSI